MLPRPEERAELRASEVADGHAIFYSDAPAHQHRTDGRVIAPNRALVVAELQSLVGDALDAGLSDGAFALDYGFQGASTFCSSTPSKARMRAGLFVAKSICTSRVGAVLSLPQSEVMWGSFFWVPHSAVV